MSAQSTRAARREEQAARSLGTKRIHRRRGESAPDVAPVRLPSGAMLGAEVKSRKRLPRLVTAALDQARRYFGARAIPVAVLYELGARSGIACLDLATFARLVGLDVATLPTMERKTKRQPKQLGLPGCGT
jgi:hypothetical protein